MAMEQAIADGDGTSHCRQQWNTISLDFVFTFSIYTLIPNGPTALFGWAVHFIACLTTPSKINFVSNLFAYPSENYHEPDCSNLDSLVNISATTRSRVLAFPRV
jgi:hypothetical protein